jgi:hypothetical protein
MTLETDPQRPHLSQTGSQFLRLFSKHAIEWRIWAPDAFKAASAAGKPVFLAIGHGACPTSHAMAKGTFSDPEVAAVLNDSFICVVVDRDERPDIGRTYGMVFQALTHESGSGPLYLFLSPDDQIPFFGGTYFSSKARDGELAFWEILRRISDYFHSSRSTIQEQNEQLIRSIAALEAAAHDEKPPTLALISEERQILEREFDTNFGGFTGAPKLVTPRHVERLLRRWAASQHDTVPDLQALYMSTLTLVRMADGGVRDHVSGGFFTQSTDAQWSIPIFEKHLGDNASMLAAYARAAIATGEPLFAATATDTAEWMLRELRQQDGLFAPSIVVRTDREAVLYYRWEREQLALILGADEFRIFVRRFGLDGTPNLGEFGWHLQAKVSTEEIARHEHLPRQDVEQVLKSGLEKLHEQRSKVRPTLLSVQPTIASNALAIRGLAIAARALGRTDFYDAALNALDVTKNRLLGINLQGTLISKNVEFPAACLDDYAFLLDADLELMETKWRTQDFEFACWLADAILEYFEDTKSGGLWITPHQAERLIARPKWFADEALPSANGVACRALQRLGYLIGEPRYLESARRILGSASKQMQLRPPAHATLLDALEESVRATECVVLRGPSDTISSWQRELARVYAPHRMVFTITEPEGALPDSLRQWSWSEKGVAYVAKGAEYLSPIHSLSDLVRVLRDGLEINED